MKVIREIAPNKKIALALGYFDGIHIGHKKIISTLVKRASAMGTESAVITFSKNPADYFLPDMTPNIQTFKDREIILDFLGVDYLYELDFEQYKDMEADVYLNDVIFNNFNPGLIVVGYNHTFGKDRKGTPAFLKANASKLGYECIIVPELKYNDIEEVSSTVIRQKIAQGSLEAVEALLGRAFSVRNSVVKGKGIATELGYPTANTVYPGSLVKVPYGVYFGFSQVESKIYPALISWGTKPTLSEGDEEALEAHLYNFSEKLYGKIIKIIFIQKIRDMQKFPNKALLKAQIKRDYAAFEKWAETKPEI